MISFGPVPSRRLGKSLGVNNIPSQKICTYSCIYCQVGLTKKFGLIRENFYDPKVIFDEVRKHLDCLHEKDMPDYLTFVSNGEPTLDKNLGESIRLLKSLNFPVAVITNASLLNDPGVRDDLKQADWVSVKTDSANESVWEKINRPHYKIHFDDYIEGLYSFSKVFPGILVTETMLVRGINDQSGVLQHTARLISGLKPSLAYISVPTRPPAVQWVRTPDEETITTAFQIFVTENLNTELILGFEGITIGYTGNAFEDIINTCTVHPIREDAMLQLLKKNKADSVILDILLTGNYIKEVYHSGNKFFIRNFNA